MCSYCGCQSLTVIGRFMAEHEAIIDAHGAAAPGRAPRRPGRGGGGRATDAERPARTAHQQRGALALRRAAARPRVHRPCRRPLPRARRHRRRARRRSSRGDLARSSRWSCCSGTTSTGRTTGCSPQPRSPSAGRRGSAWSSGPDELVHPIPARGLGVPRTAAPARGRRRALVTAAGRPHRGLGCGVPVVVRRIRAGPGPATATVSSSPPGLGRGRRLRRPRSWCSGGRGWCGSGWPLRCCSRSTSPSPGGTGSATCSTTWCSSSSARGWSGSPGPSRRVDAIGPSRRLVDSSPCLAAVRRVCPGAGRLDGPREVAIRERRTPAFALASKGIALASVAVVVGWPRRGGGHAVCGSCRRSSCWRCAPSSSAGGRCAPAGSGWSSWAASCWCRSARHSPERGVRSVALRRPARAAQSSSAVSVVNP